MRLDRDPKAHPGMLYKYCAPERADVLEGLRIRFTQPAVLNDIFEAFPGAADGFDEGRLKADFHAWLNAKVQSNPQWSRQQRREFQESQFRKFQDSLKSPERAASIAELCRIFQLRYSAVTGILCLSAKWDNVLMWAHYTQDHKGFVIEFDGTHEFFNGISQVQYSEQRPVLEIDESGRGGPEVFDIKSSDWLYEDEYRKSANFGKEVRLPNGNVFVEFPAIDEIDLANWPVRLVEFPARAVRSVIFGCRISAETRTRVRETLLRPELKHVSCEQASPHPKLFRMVKSPLTEP